MIPEPQLEATRLAGPVLFVEEVMPPHVGGVANHILAIARQLRPLGVEFEALTLSDDKGLPSEEEVEGIRLYRVGNVAEGVRFVRRGARRYACMHAHTSRRLFTSIMMLVGRACGMPVLFTPHCFYPPRDALNAFTKGLFDLTLGRASLAACERVIHLTPVDARDGLSCGVRARTQTIIPNSIDTCGLAADRHAEPPGDPFLLYVGRIAWNKKVDLLIEAMPSIPEPMRLRIIGPDEGYRDRFLERADALGVRDRIDWVGRAPWEDLLDAYRTCEALLLPSSYEGLPTVALEAMYFRRPVIAAPTGGTSALIEDGRNGLFCDFGRPEALAEALGRLDRIGWERIGSRALATVLADYTWQKNASRILDLYRSVGSTRTAESA